LCHAGKIQEETMAIWPVSHSEQLIANPVDGQFIENPVFTKSHRDQVTLLLHLQMAIADYALRRTVRYEFLFGLHLRALTILKKIVTGRCQFGHCVLHSGWSWRIAENLLAFPSPLLAKHFASLPCNFHLRKVVIDANLPVSSARPLHQTLLRFLLPPHVFPNYSLANHWRSA
jgi:hypothetical protein